MQIIDISLFIELIWENLYDAGWKLIVEKTLCKSQKKPKKEKNPNSEEFRTARMEFHAAKKHLLDFMIFAWMVRAAKMIRVLEIFAGDILSI